MAVNLEAELKQAKARIVMWQKNCINANREIERLEAELAESERQTRAQLSRVGQRDRRIERLEAKVAKLRRSLDNIKVRGYELGQKEIHDMALEALQEDI